MTDPRASDPGVVQAFLTFEVDRRLYALHAKDVSEVIRTPAYARAPFAPAALLGLANLRGAVTPLASARVMLGRPGAPGDAPGAMTIVLHGASPVGLAVDRVANLATIAANEVRGPEVGLAATEGEPLAGLFLTAGGDAVRLLDLDQLIVTGLAPPTGARSAARRPGRREEPSPMAPPVAAKRGLLAFEVAGQRFALDLARVLEVIGGPEGAAPMPDSDAAVLGVAAWREGLLPLLSLSVLLGLPRTARDAGAIIVTSVSSARVGLVCDRTIGLIGADPGSIEPVPSVVAARVGGEARVEGIYRPADGASLVAILAADRLFGEDVMDRLGKALRSQPPAAPPSPAMRSEPLLLFRLCGEVFGLPIDVVEEVAVVPDGVTRIPHAPDFVEGVVNLRGELLPVIDQRRRFDMPASPPGRDRRLISVRSGPHRACLLVDSVSGVIEAAEDRIVPMPGLTGDAARLIRGVADLPGQGGLILILDPIELLSHAERDLLEAWTADDARS